MQLVALVCVPLAVVVWAHSARVAIALLLTAITMCTCAAVLAYWFLNQPEIFATLVFVYLLLPFVIAPLAGVMGGFLVGPPRHLFACAGAAVLGCIAALLFMPEASAGPIVGMRECFRDMAAPSVFSASAAAFTAFLASRRA